MERSITIKIEAASELEALSKQQALQTIARYLTKENLLYISEKAKNPKVNERINGFRQGPFKNFL